MVVWHGTLRGDSAEGWRPSVSGVQCLSCRTNPGRFSARRRRADRLTRSKTAAVSLAWQAVLSSAYEPRGHRGDYRCQRRRSHRDRYGGRADSGRRATSRDTQKALEEQRTRTLNERFATAAGQLGGDKPPAVRLADVYAMAGLADDWPENRQTCADVLCAYLRLPYAPDPGNDASVQEQLDFRASREVRHTVIRVIAAHLSDGAAVSWRGLSFDFNGVVFDGGDFRGAVFSGGLAVFDGADFSSGTVRFNGAKFAGGEVFFGGAKFSGGKIASPAPSQGHGKVVT